jgi:phage recombination protein Bet
MTGNELATTTSGHGSALILSADQERWNEQQIAALRQLGLQDASQGDLDVFFHVSQRTGLDPFARQIHMIARKVKVFDGPQDKQGHYETKCTIQTGIDGYRVTAHRAAKREGDTLEYEDTEWCGEDGVWRDVWLSQRPPAAARVTVLKNGHPFPGLAIFAEYVQTKNNGEPNSMWAKMPAGQLAKCAEALALRKAYPQDFANLYTDEEMGQADNGAPARAGRTTGAGSGGLAASRARRRAEQEERAVLDPGSDLGVELFKALDAAGVALEDRLSYIAEVVGRPINGGVDVTRGDARKVIDHMQGGPNFPTDDETVDAELVPDDDTTTPEG